MAQATEATESGSTVTEAAILQMDWSRSEAEEIKSGVRFEDESPSADQICGVYELVGAETFRHTDSRAIVGGVWERWNRGSGVESEQFVEAETRSVSVGDIVVIEDTVYLYAPIGYDELDVTREEIEGVLTE
jgi:hypothetical protein